MKKRRSLNCGTVLCNCRSYMQTVELRFTHIFSKKCQNSFIHKSLICLVSKILGPDYFPWPLRDLCLPLLPAEKMRVAEVESHFLLTEDVHEAHLTAIRLSWTFSRNDRKKLQSKDWLKEAEREESENKMKLTRCDSAWVMYCVSAD